jgi:outer membrane biosynthesis protein TonB
MRSPKRRLLALAVLLVAAFSISFAVARAGQGDEQGGTVPVPGIAPEAVSSGAPPRVDDLGPAAPLPSLRRTRVGAPAPAPAPAVTVPQPTTPVTPAPVTPAPRQFTPAPTPTPAPKPKPKTKEFKSIG